ncbi:MAG: lipocalin family protein [Candidatus Delongbacteria bacterium]|nr:lipocalin family protein [Candidatus Delongbacteria bacterium]MBN2837053.1 lipocalin family protein [Candidatus Delongbacteria bacterium]
MKLIALILATIFVSCVSIPKGLKAVKSIDLEKYLGRWYEIVRLDHSFERDLSNVTADYSLKEDGGIKVLNKGYDLKSNKWKNAEGVAYFIDDENREGRLKVSFFRPFYGGYNIILLDDGYEWSVVAGPDFTYLWILSRTPSMDKTLLKDLVSRLKIMGFDTEKFIYVDQSKYLADSKL